MLHLASVIDALRRVVILLIVCLVPLSAKADGKPAIVQAEALLAEHAGAYAKALGLLREAYALAPADVDIAFDRARIALEHPEAAQPADLDDYLDVDATTPDQRLLRAYILIARGRSDEARDVAVRVAQLDPANAEAKALVEGFAQSRRELGTRALET